MGLGEISPNPFFLLYLKQKDMANRGTWTEDAIVSAIRNNLEAGMKTTSNYTFSNENLRYIVYAVRNEMVNALLQTNEAIDLQLIQEINCVELDCEDFGLCKKVDTRKPALHFKIPEFVHIDYLGLSDVSTPFKVYQGKSGAYNSYRNKKLVSRPYVRLREFEGQVHGFVFNPPTPNLKFISVHGIWQNPRDVNQYQCCVYNPREHHFPMPDYMVSQMIDSITAKWASYYYRFTASKANRQTPVDEA